MTGESITIARAGLTTDVSRSLIAALNAELIGMYPEPGVNHFHLDAEEVVFVLYRENTPVGCGALRVLDREAAELKPRGSGVKPAGVVDGARFGPGQAKEQLALDQAHDISPLMGAAGTVRLSIMIRRCSSVNVVLNAVAPPTG